MGRILIRHVGCFRVAIWALFMIVESRFCLKPLEPAPLFQVQAFGPNLPPNLHDTQGIQALLNSVSGRTDIVLQNATWISEWT